MQGYLAIVLHAHLPYVRHPEHDRFLEESWLFQAITECYLPLIRELDGWLSDGMQTRMTLTLTPTLCSMLRDPLLQDRYVRYLEGLISLAEKEISRTHWDRPYRELAWYYHWQLTNLRNTWFSYGQDLVVAFRKFQEQGQLEIITCAATHGLL
ncbi:MAG: 1,4-alpha-glucan branching enzyme, partial [Limisphaerales bacterium]